MDVADGEREPGSGEAAGGHVNARGGRALGGKDQGDVAGAAGGGEAAQLGLDLGAVLLGAVGTEGGPLIDDDDQAAALA